MLDKVFKLIWLNHPKTGKADVLMSLAVFVVVICAIKFLFDGVVVNIFGHTFSFGHTDSFSYGTFLSPVLGAHGYLAGKNTEQGYNISRVDNPDESEDV